MCQINNYKNALPAGRLIPIVSNYPNEIVTLDLLDQFRIYRHRKCDETEIGTGSSDNGNLPDESSSFDKVQSMSNELRDGKKKGSEVKRELEEKGLSFRNNQGNKRSNESRSGGPERKVQKGSEHRVKKRGLSSNNSNSVLPRLRKKNRREKRRKEDQFDPEKAEKGTIVHTSKSEQDQATRVPDEEVINNGKTRKGEERVQRNPCHWRSCWQADWLSTHPLCEKISPTCSSNMVPTLLYRQDVAKLPLASLPVTHIRPFSRNHSNKYPTNEKKGVTLQ
ncbi:uncharacterized protein TNCV_424611 [Trichonephila clavipes]|nr:uncharacterized protein TNCV_424611 [Trichonephila clavipes]